MPTRKKIAAANWKMHKDPLQAQTFFKDWQKLLGGDQLGAEVVIFPPAYCLETIAVSSRDLGFKFGPQNIHTADEGAFTGEVSPLAVVKMGASYALIGHSERRTLFSETNELIAKKNVAALRNRLTPMFCVGESLSERESKKTNAILKEQLVAGISEIKSVLGAESQLRLVIAYEPVWAIGTGKVATPDMAEEAHIFIRQCLGELLNKSQADSISILYGGSVKPDNAFELAKMANIDGFLVCGASLDPQSFFKIAKALNSVSI